MRLSDYVSSTADWRERLRQNQRRTQGVIAVFIAIYVTLGFLVDVFVVQSHYPYLSLSQSCYVLITFQITPFATLLLGILALICLIATYTFYDRLMLMGTDYHEITPESTGNLQEQQLYHVLEEMKIAAGLQYMPKLYVIEANYMNAFASGYSEKSAMIAITRGLMNKLDRAELQAVMAHELSHIRHQDIKLTLMVAVLGNILLMVIDLLFYAVISGRNRRGNNAFVGVIVALRYLLPLLTVILALFLSRTREYMADAGCVELMRDNEPLARALLKIEADQAEHAEEYTAEYRKTPHEEVRQAAYLFDPSESGIVKSMNGLFSTHPPIAERLRAIGFKRKN